jgi:hypothetical protein
MIRRHSPCHQGQYSASAHSEPGASHHERHCKICSHTDRSDIEADFVEWAQPDAIAREYNISRSSIYRHARAVGLFVRRNCNLRFALGRVIEWVDSVEPTADSIVRAIHAFARINDEGQWVEPPAHVIVSSGGIRREAAAPSGRRPIAISLDSPAMGNVLDVPAEAALPAPANTLPGIPAAPLQRDAPAGSADAFFGAGALPGTPNRVETDATC